MNNERREFIKSACSLCAAVVGIGALLPAVSACATLPNLSVEPTDGVIPVQRNLFTAQNQLVIVQSKKENLIWCWCNKQVLNFKHLNCNVRTNQIH